MRTLQGFARYLLAPSVAIVVGVPLAWAQPGAPESPASPTPRPGYAVTIDAPAATPRDRTVVFRAETPDTPPSGTFVWTIAPDVTLTGQEVTHTFSAPGRYEIVLTHKLEEETYTAKHGILVYERAVALFTDPQDTASARALEDRAAELHVALTTITIPGGTSVLRQQAFEERLAEEQGALEGVDMLLVALSPDVALPTLISIGQRPLGEALRGKPIVLADPASGSALRLARIATNALAPSHVLLTDARALPIALEFDATTLPKELLYREIPAVDVDSETPGPPPWALLSHLTDLMLQRGIPSQTILLILLVPLIVTVITFLRQVVGLNTMGLYVPVTMALAFVVLGVSIGFASVVAIFAAGIGVRALLRRVRLLYVARVGLATSLVVLLLLCALFASTYIVPGAIPSIAIFPVLVLTLITERAYNVIAERGLTSSLLVFIETTVVALVASVVASEWEWLRSTLIAWPEMMLAVIVVQLLIGKYTGLRATELFRFRELLNEVEYAEEE